MIQQSHFWAYIWKWWKTLIWKDTGTPGFIAPLFTVAKTWKQPKCPSIDKRIKKTENEMVGWHHWLDGREFEQALGVGDGQGSLAYCSPWSHKESDTTDWLNWYTYTHTHTMKCYSVIKKNEVLPFALIWVNLEIIMGFLIGAAVKNLPAIIGDARDTGSIPESGRSAGVGNGNPL